ncbi:MAG: Sensor-like histidine kinase senX3, partial [Alphaproteobacteria bacterium MarineAlpha5_Bin5]
NEYLNLNYFLYDVSNYFAYNNKKIKIFIEEKDQNISVLANKNKLLQVFINIIENSISIAGNNSQILIEISIYNKNNVQVKIYDQGKGIVLTDKEKIFERFYSDRTNDKDHHTGLGLSIAKEIILSFKGLIKLTVSDKKNYSGACFVIILPIRTIGRNEQ